MQTIKDYARRSGDDKLMGLVSKLDQPRSVPAASSAKAQPATVSPKDRDFASILAVIDRLDRPVGSADLGRLRRRWLEYPPRGEITGVHHRNRLEDPHADGEGRGSPTCENRERSDRVFARRKCRSVSRSGGVTAVT